MTLQTLAQAEQNGAQLDLGLALTCTGTPALNATYAVDENAQLRIMAQFISFLMSANTFTNGTTSMQWPDINGTLHTFTVAQFKAFGGAINKYLDAVSLVSLQLANGTVVAWPSNAATIA